MDGTDVRANLSGSGEQAPFCNVQNEVTLVWSGERLVAAWNDGGECARLILGRFGLDNGVGLSLTGYRYSADGGWTWVDGEALSPPPDQNLQGDPVLAAGPEGNFYLATLIGASEEEGGPPRRLRIGVARSQNGGVSWSIPVDASAGRGSRSRPRQAVDRGRQHESPHRGDVYVAWTELFSDCEGSPTVRALPEQAQRALPPIRSRLPSS